MGHNDNFIQQEYQVREQRKQRFLSKSTDTHFYLETFDGGMICPNSFGVHTENNSSDIYFIIYRSGSIYMSMTIIIGKDGRLFSMKEAHGNIYDDWQDIEQMIRNTELFEIDHFIQNFNKVVNDKFAPFQISIKF